MLWPEGTLTAGELPDGSSFATVRGDGSIIAKPGWWRGTPGRLHVTGERLDAKAPPLSADVPDGYGDSGFQVSSVVLAGPGCWRIAGQAGGDPLEFVVRVRLAPQ